MHRLKICCGTPSCSEACLFFGDDLLRLWLQSIQYDLQHDFAWVTDEAQTQTDMCLELCIRLLLVTRGLGFRCDVTFTIDWALNVR